MRTRSCADAVALKKISKKKNGVSFFIVTPWLMIPVDDCGTL
jgi:hypothetical protein